MSKKLQYLEELDDISVLIKERPKPQQNREISEFAKGNIRIFRKYRERISDVLNSLMRMILVNSESLSVHEKGWSIGIPGGGILNIDDACETLNMIWYPMTSDVLQVDIKSPESTKFTSSLLLDILDSQSITVNYLLGKQIIDPEYVRVIDNLKKELDCELLKLIKSIDTGFKVKHLKVLGITKLRGDRIGVGGAIVSTWQDKYMTMVFSTELDSEYFTYYYGRTAFEILDNIYRSYSSEIDKSPVESV